MRKKRKWQSARPSLRERVESREERRRYGQLFAENDSEYRQINWEDLPAKMLKPLQEHLFQKTVAAILTVICLGLFSLLNLPLTNRITAAIHYLTVYQTNPAELVQTAKPVIQSMRDLNWRPTAAVPPTPDPANGHLPAETMAAPVNGVVKRAYGPSLSLESGQMEMHYGIDVAAAAGSSVFAAFSGTVSLIKGHPDHGLTVYLEHAGNKVTIYGRVTDIAVAAGESVVRGQVIAKVAVSGAGDSHLHFEIWENKQPVDPEKFLTDSE
ncbi:MAG: M23 family metallopeptidase [Dethiobacter sp.]|jgi:murein DD-endopeptidase MepM/ murein hydrolase activator NlpD|nr:M23 family metallopeptidase [Dethiobacter sp.]MBS3901184.1 M23 family metallopeptidase [Dethiobacter sp.]MBS3989124.1 M23 family metallopeptidase [Dethiobacter sp.]